MWVPVVFEFLAVGVLTWLTLRRFGSWKATPALAYATTYVGWMISFSIVVLLTIDVSSTVYEACRAGHLSSGVPPSSGEADQSGRGTCGAEPWTYLPHPTRYVLWNVFYWTTFALTWLVVPLQQSYVEAGDFSFWGKCKTSIRENALFYGAMGVLLGIFLVYIMATKHLYGSDLVGFAIAASNAWGLFLLVALLGYGLVEVPRALWHAPDYERGIRLAEFRADNLLVHIEDAKTELVTCIATVKNMEEPVARHFESLHRYFDVLLAATPLEYEARMQLHLSDDETAVDIDAVSRSYIAALHGRMKRAVREVETAEAQFDALMDSAFFLQDVVKARGAPQRTVVSLLRPPRRSRLGPLLDKLEWWWYVRLAPYALRIAAVALAALSALVVWSECVLFLVNSKHKDRVLSVFALAIHSGNITDAGLQICVFFPVLYLCVCAYSTLFKVQLFSYYKLVPGGLSSANSLLFSAAYLSRLAAPICYNYLLLLHEFEGVDTAFANIMGDMTAVPFLGEQFNTIFPLFILILCLCTLFNVYSRILAWLHIRSFMFEDSFDDSDAPVGLGRSIVARERARRERAIKSGISGRRRSALTDSSARRPLADTTAEARPLEPINLDLNGLRIDDEPPTDATGAGAGYSSLRSLLAGPTRTRYRDDDDKVHSSAPGVAVAEPGERGRAGDGDDESPVYRFSGRNLFDDL
ncbi:LMBR1 domain-containing protein 2-B [Thecamonas trahens ATCC 50062]|uniref:LMBR1 domain-containing protein 2-B n=1 Tax=Thecamonas trahens ATCC 50062 TaxID=461836 RepID=A0A0L0DCG2_THETB|nr:LMBR1 domain-containing protein 2-B [Thecamonas trahens ATCC 50062]KNC49781.1 LMBR1 domain-containing protein 2-B [Thecamonas trahens ATCC 50062]|eukprot:XP_013757565.1 LMBR1 domain-containing protein 2-B [Thecamonas trahens ATCC 50062]